MSHRKAPSLRVLTIAVTSGVLGLAATPAQACSSDNLLGSICFMAGKSCPKNYVPADGAILSINKYAALYAIFGKTFGGDGVATFALPDLRGRAAVGTGRASPYVDASPTILSLGTVRGAESATLTLNQMPAHTHRAAFTGTESEVTILPKLQVAGANPTTAATSVAPSTATPYLAGAVSAGPATLKMWLATPGTPMVDVGGLALTISAAPPQAWGGASVINEPAGGSHMSDKAEPFLTISPEVVMTACVAINGIFPPKPY